MFIYILNTKPWINRAILKKIWFRRYEEKAEIILGKDRNYASRKPK